MEFFRILYDYNIFIYNLYEYKNVQIYNINDRQ